MMNITHRGEVYVVWDWRDIFVLCLTMAPKRGKRSAA